MDKRELALYEELERNGGSWVIGRTFSDKKKSNQGRNKKY
jgi:hypothetical protein